ncbi:uncharacterized protein LOC110191967 [Drosophila serrata]|uniref:uncharacterized protein LOC110191967 n=1 Tax=Drosophila serrata TaxID=7274 RepID=UPI000A1D275B|nr:uncharacterized protein LOC110191967 [Drosophila serrata]
MCFKLNRRGYCYLMAIFTYSNAAIEITYSIIMLIHYGEHYDWLWALIFAWFPILFAGMFLIIGTCLSDSYLRTKRVLLKIWIAVAIICGFAIIIIKIGIIVRPFVLVGIWRNILRIVVFCCFLLLVFSFVYFPCLYVQDLDEELDF